MLPLSGLGGVRLSCARLKGSSTLRQPVLHRTCVPRVEMRCGVVPTGLDDAGHLEREATLSFGQSQESVGNDDAFRKNWLVGRLCPN
jgi:hypothetical protein